MPGISSQVKATELEPVRGQRLKKHKKAKKEMPKFLEKKLKKQYPDNPSAVYGTMNKLGFMHGNKETAKGKAAEKKHMSKKSSRSRAVTGSSNTPRASVTGSTVSVAPGLSSSKNVHKKSKMSKRKMFTKNIMAGARY